MAEAIIDIFVGSDYGPFSLSNFKQFLASLSSALQALDAVRPDLARRLFDIRSEYSALGGWEYVYDRMNSKSVRQILAEYAPSPVEPVASGEVDGVKYQLHEAPGGKITPTSEDKTQQ